MEAERVRPPDGIAEFAEKTVCLQRKGVNCGKCGFADGLKLQDFPHFGRRAPLNGVQEVAGATRTVLSHKDRVFVVDRIASV
jgi:hypothetical protein